VTVSGGSMGRHAELSFASAQIWERRPFPQRQTPLGAAAQALLVEMPEVLGPIRGVAGAEGLVDALRTERAGGIVRWARSLIGAGPGLTPLGDDVVGGALFALRSVGAGDRRGVEELVVWAQDRTSRLSWCLLADLSDGHGPAPLHQLAEALCAGRMDAARAGAQELAGLGHTTGRGILAGALAVWASQS